MHLNKRQTLARNRINRIENAIRTAIDKECQSEDFDISYAEINAALIKTMETFNGHELKLLWSTKKTEL